MLETAKKMTKLTLYEYALVLGFAAIIDYFIFNLLFDLLGGFSMGINIYRYIGIVIMVLITFTLYLEIEKSGD